MIFQDFLDQDLLVMFHEITKLPNSQPIAFIISFCLAFFLTPLVKKRAELLPKRNDLSSQTRKNKLLNIDGNSSLKKDTLIKKLKFLARLYNQDNADIPRLGGLSILFSIICTIVFYLVVYGRYTPSGIQHFELEAIIAGSLIIISFGLLDDLKPLKSSAKLIGQIFAASLTWYLGLRVTFIANPLSIIPVEIGQQVLDAIGLNNHTPVGYIQLNIISSYLITCIFLILITNAINLIDGIDGLAVGVSLISSLAIWALSLSELFYRPDAAILAATIAGSCFAFLRYNFNPARIYLGDSGSYLLGFLLACLACLGLGKKVTVATMMPAALSILSIPLFDLLWTLIRRTLKGCNIMEPDLEHLHHKLVESGLNHKQVAFITYIFSILGAGIAMLLIDKSIFLFFISLITITITAWLVFSLIINNKKQKI